MNRIGILGLGRIGRAVASCLIADGLHVAAVRRPSTRDFPSLGGHLVESPAVLARESDVVISCLPTPEALREAFLGRDGLVLGAGPDVVVVEMSTFPVALKRAMALRPDFIGADSGSTVTVRSGAGERIRWMSPSGSPS